MSFSRMDSTQVPSRTAGEEPGATEGQVIAPFLGRTPQVGTNVRFIGAAEVAEDATEKTPFGGRERPEESNSPRHLLRVVPIPLEVE